MVQMRADLAWYGITWRRTATGGHEFRETKDGPFRIVSVAPWVQPSVDVIIAIFRD